MSKLVDEIIAAVDEAEALAPPENDVLYEDHWINEVIRTVGTGRTIEGHAGARLVRVNREPYRIATVADILNDAPEEEGPTYLPGEALPVNTGVPCAPCLNAIGQVMFKDRGGVPRQAAHKVCISAGSLIVEFQFCQPCMDSYRAAYPGIVSETIFR